jgi:hypothetical protein
MAIANEDEPDRTGVVGLIRTVVQASASMSRFW